MARKINKVSRIGQPGGLIGALVFNTKTAYEKEIATQNADGWNLCEIQPLANSNLFMLLIRIIILVLTLGLFTLGSNTLLVFEKDA